MPTPLTSLLARVQSNKGANKLLYTIQTSKKRLDVVKPEEKWENEFSNDSLEWNRIYTVNIQSTLDSTLRNFQYKYLMRIIGTNKLLFRCRMVPSSLCDFCSMNVENIKHLFWECIHVQHFWSQLREFLIEKGFNFTLDFKSISFGIINSNFRTNQLNFIIILAKYFIVKCKYEKQNILFNLFMNYLKRKLDIEKEIATMKDKMDEHTLRWSNFDL